MKVENPHAHPSVALGPVDRDLTRRTGTPAAQAGGDRIQWSGDVDLAQQAMRAADPATVRPDAVERGRRLLESGALGTDLDQLAGQIIDALADSHDDIPS
jgi:hypothetical protein